jgi:hypothetical protein
VDKLCHLVVRNAHRSQSPGERGTLKDSERLRVAFLRTARSQGHVHSSKRRYDNTLLNHAIAFIIEDLDERVKQV